MSHNMMVTTGALIEKVREHPALWDRECSAYGKKLEKEQAWEQICEEMIPMFKDLDDRAQVKIIHEITKKWFNVRDSYVKSLRGNNKQPYRHSISLSFLDHIYQRRTRIEHKKIKTEEIVQYDDEEDFEDDKQSDNADKSYLETVYIDIDDDVSPPKKIKASPKSAEQPTSSCTNDAISALFNSLIEREDDDDKAFFNSIMPTLKTLSNDRKLQFRIDVMTLLRRLSKPVKEEIDPIDGNVIE